MRSHHVTKELTISGRGFRLSNHMFHFQGLSFFNALYNTAFNRSPEDMARWLRTFKANGVTVLRIWAQWDFDIPSFVDISPRHSLFTESGGINQPFLERLVALMCESDRLGMVIELVLFCNERNPNLAPATMVAVAERLTEQLLPYRNVIIQIWNEKSDHVAVLHAAIKRIDGLRIVTNSPGYANDMGSDEHNRIFDILTPHTVRGESPSFWTEAPKQLADLSVKFDKPIIDDEPARNGPTQFGGIAGGTQPWQHIEQIRLVRALGFHHVYHHDMFQYRNEPTLTPAHGIPDPDFSPFHRMVFDYLRAHTTW